MAKLLKILGNFTLMLIEISLILIIVFAFLIRTSNFQTYLAHKGAKYLSEKLDTKVSIGKVDITFLDRLYFDKLYVEDQHNDTLIYVDEFFVNFNLAGAMLLDFHLDEVGVKDARFALKTYEGEEDFNLQFVLDAFKSDTTASESPDFNINAYKVNIVNSHFSMENENAELLPYGVDFNNINGRKINLQAENVVITPESYSAKINSLSLIEKSGFEIQRLSADALFNTNGLDLRETIIHTNNSNLAVDSFLLKANDLSEFAEFVDLVQMESFFDTSYVSLKDVSYFAPQLKGMDDVVLLTGSTKNSVSQLEMDGIYLQYGTGSKLKGDFSLPDFMNISNAEINQHIGLIALNIYDLESFKLPESASMDHIKWPESLNGLNSISGTNITAQGSITDIYISMDELFTNVGSLTFKDQFRIISDTNFVTMRIIPKNGIEDQIIIKDFDLNLLLKSNDYGNLNGYIGMKSAVIKNGDFSATDLSGVLNETTLFGYPYDYITLDRLSYNMITKYGVSQNEVKGNIYVRDENFDLTFKGFASLGKTLDIKAQVNLECAMLEEINPVFAKRGELNTNVQFDISGKDFDDFKGNLLIDTLFYQEGEESFSTTNFYAFMDRSANKDSISIKSDLVDAELYGKVDYSNVVENISYQIAQIIPLFSLDSDTEVVDELTYFDYDIQIKKLNDLLDIFYPAVQIADLAEIDGYYNGKDNNLGLNINADYISYDSIRIKNIRALQEVSNQELLALIDIDTITINDSLAFKDIHFTGLAADGEIDSQLLFEDPTDSRSNVEWLTNLREEGGFIIDILPSYINVNEHLWNLKKMATISYADSCFVVEGLKLEHENQYISAQGNLSSSIYDKLYVDIMDLNLDEFGNILGPDISLSGIANLAGYITTPLTNLQFFGEAIVEEFFINDTEVGNVSFGANYQADEDKIKMFGDIFYRNEQTFAFDGNYLLKEDENIGRLDFDMIFKSTDISAVNEFMDPDVISNLQGKLKGKLKLTGTFQEPQLLGTIDFHDGMVNLAILGSDMFFNGEIESVKDGFYIDLMPIKDVEGNTGFVTGSLFHNNFKDFLFEIIVNLEEHPTLRMPNDRSRALPVDRFKIMNTKYDINSAYYGDAYVTGIANISGTLDDLSIIVNAKTRRGTKFVLPMYGPTTIEEDGFISFKKEGNEEENEKKVDLTGVNLQLNFDVTEDAEAKLIFDEKIGDEISARGNGKISLSVDQFNDLAMDGTYTVASGVYNFALGPYKQNFNIQPGGSVQWAGDPFEAILDINAYYKTTANLSVVMPNVVENSSSNNEEIYSYLTLKGSMMSPEISFDLEAPRATESGKAVINRIRSDPDELNKQFFSILISKSFMQLSGSGSGTGGGGGAFLDLAATQINALLGKISEDYIMNVNLENDEYSGQFSGEFGVSKGFLDDRLLISGSFGVGTMSSTSSGNTNYSSQNTLIGDVKVEYLLNEPGTFRMNVFNESNNHTVLQNEGRGQFTQGVGVSYKEDFHTLEDFKLFQFFANIFRKREDWVDLKDSKDKRVPIPKEYIQEKAIKNDE
ncbi:translocation/assembly module TamB domain-containing protein [Brumimicrobium mesophilum]|uniref:translocation/assembly module TamB domain-containing protein n=1 Tax=Brumimicrobium mesophilum TaxID=392717 RepID=UPI000D1421EA|nr:translocation/assembly module TamB domain-containing protein [Brumimicrobium mesophilum]